MTRPSEEDIAAITSDPRRVEELRKRLSSISCFMGKLNESMGVPLLRSSRFSGPSGGAAALFARIAATLGQLQTLGR